MNKYIAKKIIFLIESNEPFVIATILKCSGSVPRKKGARMIVTKSGNIYSSVGGGLLEAKVIEISKKIIKENKTRIIDMNLSPKRNGDMGMICGGQISVMINPIFPEKRIKRTLELCLSLSKSKRPCLFITIFNKKKSSAHHLALNLSDLSKSSLFLNKNDIELIKCRNNYLKEFELIETDSKLIVASNISIPNKVYILGAGHVAQPTAIMASMVGFSVTVMDDRIEFANQNRFPNVEKVKVINFYDDLFVDIGKEVFIIIITRGHFYDKIVLQQALLTNASYIGMIGSNKKKNAIFNDLKKNGVLKKDLDRVFSPIGLDIGSETPEEIALSIVAEMVLVRSGGKKRYL